MVKTEDLIIPVYLNQRIVFDLVAMIEGGIAAVTQVTTSEKAAGTASAEASGTFGLSKALSSLLRIDLSGKAAASATGESDRTRSEERIHTPASLFIALRAILREKHFIKEEADSFQPRPGDIVEFSAVLRQNPLLETIGAFVEMIDLIQAFGEKPAKGHGKEVAEMQKVKKQMEAFIAKLKVSDTMDLTTHALPSSHRCVITLEKQYLNDPSMSDLVDGSFRVVGKVIREIAEREGSISLNRKSALGRLPNSIMNQFKVMLQQPELEEFALPELEWEIPGPVIQVLPIAIFA